MAQGRGIEVECVAVSRIAESIDDRTDVVAVSAVQSSTGGIDAIHAHDLRRGEAARHTRHGGGARRPAPHLIARLHTDEDVDELAELLGLS